MSVLSATFQCVKNEARVPDSPTSELPQQWTMVDIGEQWFYSSPNHVAQKLTFTLVSVATRQVLPKSSLLSF